MLGRNRANRPGSLGEAAPKTQRRKTTGDGWQRGNGPARRDGKFGKVRIRVRNGIEGTIAAGDGLFDQEVGNGRVLRQQ